MKYKFQEGGEVWDQIRALAEQNQESDEQYTDEEESQENAEEMDIEIPEDEPTEDELAYQTDPLLNEFINQDYLGNEADSNSIINMVLNDEISGKNNDFNLDWLNKKDNSVMLGKTSSKLSEYLNSLPAELKNKLIATSGSDSDVHAKNSRHYSGEAVDLRFNNEVYDYMLNDPLFKKMGLNIPNPNHGTAKHIHLEEREFGGDGGTPDPIYTSNKNDPRLMAYQDSVNQHQKFLNVQKFFTRAGYPINSISGDKAYIRTPNDFSPTKLMIQGRGEGVKGGDFYREWTYEGNNSDWNAVPNEKKRNLPLFRGKAETIYSTPVYQKPVQPIQYQDSQKQQAQPVLLQPWQRLPDGEPISSPRFQQVFNQVPNQVIGNPLNFQPKYDGDYSVTNRTNKGDWDQRTQKFPSADAFEAYINAMRESGQEPRSVTRGDKSGQALFQRELGGDGGQPKPKQLPGVIVNSIRKPIIINDANDPRIKSYQDSLIMYKRGIAMDNAYKNMGYNSEGAINYDMAQRISSLNGNKDYSKDAIKPIYLNYQDKGEKQLALTPSYKYPEQEYKFQKSADSFIKPLIVNNVNDPRLQAYKDSLDLNKLSVEERKKYEKMANDPHIQQKWLDYTKDAPVDKAFLRLEKYNGHSPEGVEFGNEKGTYGQVFDKPRRSVIYEKPIMNKSFSRLPNGETISTNTQVPILNIIPQQLNDSSLSINPVTDSNYSATVGSNTQNFANRNQFEAFIEAMRSEDNQPDTVTRTDNSGSVLFKRASRKYEFGGETNNIIKGPIGFLNSYIQSNQFKNRFKGSPSQYNETQNLLNKGSSKYSPIILEKDDPKDMIGSRVGNSFINNLAGVDQKYNIILSNPQAKQAGADLINDILPHEYTHTIRELNDSENFEFKLFNRNKENNTIHDNRPSENYSDLNSIRYLMFKQGIYDTRTGEMTEDHIKKALRDPVIKNSPTFKRMRKSFSDKDIIKLNNTIAYNTLDDINNEV